MPIEHSFCDGVRAAELQVEENRATWGEIVGVDCFEIALEIDWADVRIDLVEIDGVVFGVVPLTAQRVGEEV